MPSAIPATPVWLLVSYLDVSRWDATSIYSVRLSAEGRYAVVRSYGLVVLYDRETGETRLVNQGPNDQPLGDYVSGAAIAGDGRTVAFWSTISDLAEDAPEAGCAPDPYQQCASVFIYDAASQSLDKIAVGAPVGGVGGIEPGTALSADGRYVVFWANGLLYSGTYLFDRSTGAFSQISLSSDGADISADGRLVAFAAQEDVFVLDRATGSVEPVNLTPEGEPADGASGTSTFHEGSSLDLSLSADGRFVVFTSTATNLTEADLEPCRLYSGEVLPACRHVYVFDRETGQTELISLSGTRAPGNHVSEGGVVSGNGQYVLFTSFAGNLTKDNPCRGYQMPCPQVYLRDRQRGQTFLLTPWQGYQPDDSSFASDITADGRFAAYISRDSNLLPDTMRGAQGALVADLFALLASEG